jgi:DNA-binding NarL/FixJ family response regulator
MTVQQQIRADIARERALVLAQMVRERAPDAVDSWLRQEVPEVRDMRDMLIVLAAAIPPSTRQLGELWAWTDNLPARRLRLVSGRPSATQRRAQIPELREQGWTMRRIAELLGVSRRQIEEDIKKLRADGIMPPAPDRQAVG